MSSGGRRRAALQHKAHEEGSYGQGLLLPVHHIEEYHVLYALSLFESNQHHNLPLLHHRFAAASAQRAAVAHRQRTFIMGNQKEFAIGYAVIQSNMTSSICISGRHVPHHPDLRADKSGNTAAAMCWRCSAPRATQSPSCKVSATCKVATVVTQQKHARLVE